jgi:hypothetical protein
VISRRRQIATAQAAYYAATAAPPFISRQAFERVTGHKTDWWLVVTVASLVGAVGTALGASAYRREPGPETVVLGAGSAAVLGAIDVIYVWRGRISRVYLLDAAVQAPLALAWLVSAARGSSAHAPSP